MQPGSGDGSWGSVSVRWGLTWRGCVLSWGPFSTRFGAMAEGIKALLEGAAALPLSIGLLWTWPRAPVLVALAGTSPR